MTNAQPTESEPDLLFGVPAIAQFLGLGEWQARHQIRNGRIPTFKIGKSICARRSTLQTWLNDLEKSQPEKEDKADG